LVPSLGFVGFRGESLGVDGDEGFGRKEGLREGGREGGREGRMVRDEGWDGGREGGRKGVPVLAFRQRPRSL